MSGKEIKKMRNWKKIVAFLLIACVVTGALPMGTFGEWILAARAEAEAASPVNQDAFTALLQQAEERKETDSFSDGPWQYVLIKEKNYAVVTGYRGEPDQALSVPDRLGGADTVGIAAAALSALKGVSVVEIPGNVLAIGAGALPRGAKVRSVHASYAHSWAQKNGHAFQPASDFDFCDGVVDLSDIRPENFLRVSAGEVRLRELEASRLAVGKRFFLPDPDDLYQIAYYEAASISEPDGGMVTVTCTTPGVKQVFRYYEAENQEMRVDPESIVLYEGATLVRNGPSTRKTASDTFSKANEIGINFSHDFEMPSGNTLGIGIKKTTSYRGSYKVGLFIDNEATVEETDELSVTVSYKAKAVGHAKENKQFSDEMKDLYKFLREDKLHDQAVQSRHVANVGKAVVFSAYGIINVQVTFRVLFEISGSVSLTYSSKVVTTVKAKEGRDTSTVSETLSKSITGEAKCEFKAGTVVSLEIKVLTWRIAGVDIFLGLKGSAKLKAGSRFERIENGETKPDQNQFDILGQMLTASEEIVLPEDININMLDCVEVSLHFVVEISLSVGAGKDLTFASGTITLLDVELLTLHFHLCLWEYEPEPFTTPEEWALKDSYTYTRSGVKLMLHLDYQCPYDYHTVKFILPYAQNKVIYYNNRVTTVVPVEEPALSEQDSIALGYQFQGWFTSPGYEKSSLLKSWPQRFAKDTTVYAKAEKMHKVRLLAADRSRYDPEKKSLPTGNVRILYGDNQSQAKMLGDQYDYIANDEFLELPSRLPDGTAVSWWIRVASEKDLTPLGYSEENDAWQIRPGSLVRITGEEMDTLHFYAVTEKDVALFFHTQIRGITYMKYGHRGETVPVPACDVAVNRLFFEHWETVEGTAVGDSVRIALSSPDQVHFYALWAPGNNVTAVDITDPHIGSTDPQYGGTVPSDPLAAFTFERDDEKKELTITGYNGDGGRLRIPGAVAINNETYTVRKIAPGAFQGETSLVSVILPNTIGKDGLSISAFSGCTALKLIDLSSTGVDYIPANFARSCRSLQCVRLPMAQSGGTIITGIGSGAFENCQALDSVRLNFDVGASAFQGCENLTSAALGAGVTKIGNYAFANCTRLTRLTIPDSVTEMGNYVVLGDTGLLELDIEADIEQLTADQMNIGVNSRLRKVTVGACIRKLGDYVFANGEDGFANLTEAVLHPVLTAIGQYIFRGSGITELTIAFPRKTNMGNMVYGRNILSGMDHLTKVTVESGNVSYGIFSGDRNLKEVVLLSGVSAIYDSAFSGCTALEKVDMAGSSVTHIGDEAFRNCTSLKKLEIPQTTATFGNKILSGCTGLEELVIEGNGNTCLYASTGILSAGSVPFYIGENASLKTLTIGDGVSEIGSYAFANGDYGFTKLETLNLGTGLETIDSYAFRRAGVENLNVLGSPEIRQGAFSGCARLKHLFLASGASGARLCEDCPNLETVEIRAGTVPELAFSGCARLNTVSLGPDVVNIGNFAFANTPISRLEIPDSVTFYGRGMILGCTGLTYLRIGSGIGDTIGPWPDSYKDAYNISYNYSETNPANPFYIGPGSQLKTLVLAEGIRTIAANAFRNQYRAQFSGYGYPALESVDFPSSLETIGGRAFMGSAITKLEWTHPVNVGIGAFEDITSLTRVSLSSGSIGAYAFSGCTKLGEIKLGSGVESIGSLAFRNTAVSRLEIPDSVTSYGGGMILGCKNLTYLRVGKGIGETVGPWDESYVDSFNNSVYYWETGPSNPFYIGPGSQLATLELAEGIETIGNYAFSNHYASSIGNGYPKLKTFLYPDSLKTIGSHALSGAAISVLEFRNPMTLSAGAFENQLALTRLKMAGGTIGAAAFSGCSNLTKIDLGHEVTSIGNFAFRNTAVKTLTVPDSVTSYGRGMILGCTALTHLSIGKGIGTAIGPWEDSYVDAHNNRIYYSEENPASPFYIGPENHLKTLKLADGIETIGNEAFWNQFRKQYVGDGYPELDTVLFPATLKSIGSRAFSGSALRELEFKKPVNLAASAFENMASLVRVSLKGGSIGAAAFSGCANLGKIDLGSEISSIGNFAFRNTAITRLEIPDSVTSYGRGMILGCTGLTYLRIGRGVGEAIGPWPETYLDSYNVRQKYTETNPSNPFYVGENSGLQTLDLAEGIQSIGAYAFSNHFSNVSGGGYPALENVGFPASLASVGSYAFSGSAIRDLEFSHSVNLASSAFANLASLVRVSLTGGSIGAAAFSGCANLGAIELGSEITGIGNFAFRNTGITSLSIPDSVASCGRGMIQGCTSLESLRIGSGIGASLERWPESYVDSYNYRQNYTETNPSNPFYIGPGSRLKLLELAPGFTSLGMYVLSNHFASGCGEGYPCLEYVILPESLTTIRSGNLASWKQVRELKLSSAMTALTESGALPEGLVLLSDSTNAVVSAFAQSKGLDYLVSGQPGHRLVLAGMGPAFADGEWPFSDGAYAATRGTDGDPALLPEGCAVLADLQVPSAAALNLEAPLLPEGWLFLGWYTDPDFVFPWILAGMPAVDLTLYARVARLAPVQYLLAGEGEEAETFASWQVLSGSPVPLPESLPEREGYYFDGWYENAEYTVPAAERAVPEEGLTRYGRLLPLTRITFAVNHPETGLEDPSLPTGFRRYATLLLKPGEAIRPPADPEAEGYLFEGWYLDTALEFRALPPYAEGTDRTVYGKLSRIPAGGQYRAVEGGLELVSYRLEENQDPTVYLPGRVDGQPVVSVGKYAFRNSGVVSVWLPDSVSRLSPYAFDDSSVLVVNASPANPVFASVGGVLYSRDLSELVCYPRALRLASYTMPDTVTVVAERAVAGNPYLRSVHFSSALQEIKPFAFENCTALQEVALPASCHTLRAGAFSGCLAVARFSAYGLSLIEGTVAGENGETEQVETLPRGTGMAVFGPLGSGALREWFSFRVDGVLRSDQYNQYLLKLYVDGSLLRSLYAEAGLPLKDLLWDSGEETEGKATDGEGANVVVCWYTDSALSTPWNLAQDSMPARTLSLYAERIPLFDAEEIMLNLGGETHSGLCLTGYNGLSADLAIPKSLNGRPVIALADSFLSESNPVTRLAIGGHILQIGPDALAAFTGTLLVDPGSAAAAWAEQHQLALSLKTYRLAYSVNGTLAYAEASAGTPILLDAPGNQPLAFLGWYLNPEKTDPVPLDQDGFFIMPDHDVTIYARFDVQEEEVPFTYAISGGEVTITAYTGDGENLIIPETIEGVPVAQIADGAFRGNRFLSVDLGGVRSVGAYAFADSSELEQILLPDSVTSLGEGAFSGCGALRSFTIGAGLSALPKNLLSGCPLLEEFEVSENNPAFSASEGVLFSGDGSVLLAMPANSPVQDYIIPSGVYSVADGAFAHCANLRSVTAPSSVWMVGAQAFAGCLSLERFTASGLETIGERAFFGCYSLADVQPGSSMLSIGALAFAGCPSLERITIPAGADLDPDVLIFTSDLLTITGSVHSSAQAYAEAHHILFVDPDVPAVAGVSLSGAKHDLVRGEKLQLSASLQPSGAVTGRECFWSSDDESVAIVDENGLVTALGGGSAAITVRTVGGLTDSWPVQVSRYGTVLQLPEEILLLPGQRTALPVPTGLPDYLGNPDFAYATENSEILSIREDGTFKALQPGSAVLRITAEQESILAECRVTVPAGLNTLTLPTALAEIEEDAFAGNMSAERIVLGTNVSRIGSGAFAGMGNLKQVEIPSASLSIAESAFEGSSPAIVCREGSPAYVFAVLHDLRVVYPEEE